MNDRIKAMKESLMSVVESQMHNLAEVDAAELGEVIDMIKDLEEASYYCAVVEAMEDSENKYRDHKYYNDYYMTPYEDGHMNRMYYTPKNTTMKDSHISSSYSSSPSGSEVSPSWYTEREYPHAFQDSREGRSPRSRRMYMEAKETHQDKSVQMKELEKYIQELAQDVVEMVEGSSAEEKQYLSKKISALATKVSQISD